MVRSLSSNRRHCRHQFAGPAFLAVLFPAQSFSQTGYAPYTFTTLTSSPARLAINSPAPPAGDGGSGGGTMEAGFVVALALLAATRRFTS
ncbi:MAG: hypothetical protein A3G75_12035 [Verrucomicrobia bacterium RIFCSPLOWO2_12_FULL_64_8]|nr:MAG: hypothetical protein A3G75_12035 [Verrucomicrobia bacterium RIFCSPLOWO2_12_FULL_64_8]